jgi:hypothetical protein
MENQVLKKEIEKIKIELNIIEKEAEELRKINEKLEEKVSFDGFVPPTTKILHLGKTPQMIQIV